MKIRLLADDSKYPNYAIMKISTYHKQKGDDVDWYKPIFDYQDTDILYHSRIFNFTEPYKYYPINAKIIKGGTGFDIKSKLPDEIENVTELDYSLYPECDYSILFTTRGCIRNCEFCIVRQKEGLIHDVPICSLNPNGKYILLFDNNFFANKNWKERLSILKQYNQPIDFNQGLDLRLLNEEQCKHLSEIKIKQVHCSWDNYEDKDVILPKLELLSKYIKPYKITVYVLVGFKNKNKILDEDLERVLTLRKLGVNPFAMGYIDYNDPNYKKAKIIKDFCRWVNHKAIFKSCTFEEYLKK